MIFLNSKSISEFPFFSIIIPTKNRSHLISYAIESVLIQTYQNFEIVIIDNDDSEKTQGIILSIQDSRIQYYRTGNLSMADNWDFGLKKARGTYLIILEDKMALRKNALELLYKIIREKKCEVITYLYDFFDEDTGKAFPYQQEKGTIEEIPSDYIISQIYECNYSFFGIVLPRGITSCVSKKIVEELFQGPFKRACIPVAPDFTFGYQVVLNTKSIFHLSSILVTMFGSNYSNGMKANMSFERTGKFLQEYNLDFSSFHENMPCSALTKINLVYADFFRVIQRYPHCYPDMRLNLIKYFYNLYFEIQSYIDIKCDLIQDHTEWRKALLSQSEEIQLEVQRKINCSFAKEKNNLKEKVKNSIFKYKKIFGRICGLLINNTLKPNEKSITISNSYDIYSNQYIDVIDFCNQVHQKKP